MKRSTQNPRQRAAIYNSLKEGISKTQFERGCGIARKMFQLLGIDPAVFDGLTKKQKMFLLNNESQLPFIDVASGSSVPRQYLNNIRRETYAYMQNEYVDKETKFSYKELFSYGLPVLLMLEIGNRTAVFDDVYTKSKSLAIFFDDLKKNRQLIRPEWFARLYFLLDYQMWLYSQMNFRIYGYSFLLDIAKLQVKNGFGRMRYDIKINSTESESIYFNHNGISRKAFKVMSGDGGKYKASPICIKHKKLFPESVDNERMYVIYFQSHVLQRFKERMDIFEATTRNYLLFNSITNEQKVVRNSEGQLLLRCSFNYKTLGYFPFVIYGDKLFILSFLPFVSLVCPEGEKLHQLLGLHKEDIKYLGMDKLSFYMLVDFDQVPVLLDALKETGIWETKQILDEGRVEHHDFDKVKTSFVRTFFQKLALRNAAQFPEDMTIESTTADDPKPL